MATRPVRGESGAIFEVEASMLDESSDGAKDYRASSAPPSTSAILPAEPRAGVDGRVVGSFIVAMGIVLAAFFWLWVRR